MKRKKLNLPTLLPQKRIGQPSGLFSLYTKNLPQFRTLMTWSRKQHSLSQWKQTFPFTIPSLTSGWGELNQPVTAVPHFWVGTHLEAILSPAGRKKRYHRGERLLSQMAANPSGGSDSTERSLVLSCKYWRHSLSVARSKI